MERIPTKWLAVIAGIVVVLAVILTVTGHGSHRHAQSASRSHPAPAAPPPAPTTAGPGATPPSTYTQPTAPTTTVPPAASASSGAGSSGSPVPGTTLPDSVKNSVDEDASNFATAYFSFGPGSPPPGQAAAPFCTPQVAAQVPPPPANNPNDLSATSPVIYSVPQVQGVDERESPSPGEFDIDVDLQVETETQVGQQATVHHSLELVLSMVGGKPLVTSIAAAG